MIEVTFDLGALVEHLKAAEKSGKTNFERDGFSFARSDTVSGTYDDIWQGDRVVAVEGHEVWKMGYQGIFRAVPSEVTREIITAPGPADLRTAFARKCYEFLEQARKSDDRFPFLGPADFTESVDGYDWVYENRLNGSAGRFWGTEKLRVVTPSKVVHPITINYNGGLVNGYRSQASSEALLQQ